MWFLIHGAPGDVMCGVGAAIKHPQFKDNRRFIYYGFDASCVDFVNAQSFCDDVLHVVPHDHLEYKRSVRMLCILPKHHALRKHMLGIIAERAGIPEARILQYQISHEMKMTGNPDHWESTDLPSRSIEFANEVFSNDGRLQVLLHPYSFQSNTLERHWLHWVQAMNWLATIPHVRFWLTGIGWEIGVVPENFMDLVNRTASNNDVLALQQRCDLTISTSNNLSHYAVLINKPIVTCINQAVTDPKWFFRKWYHFPKAVFVENRDDLSVFKTEVTGELKRLSSSEQVVPPAFQHP